MIFPKAAWFFIYEISIIQVFLIMSEGFDGILFGRFAGRQVTENNANCGSNPK